nr:MAG TPA: hypothetical protein [Caudoviricetes sp.]
MRDIKFNTECNHIFDYQQDNNHVANLGNMVTK